MICTSITLLLLMTASQAAPSQTAPAATNAKSYDVVSVRQNKSGAMNSSVRMLKNGFNMTNGNVMQFLLMAFGPRSPRLISGLPDWTQSARFDCDAKMDEDTFAVWMKLPPTEANNDRMLMMQQILVDRFKLKVHHELKELPAYSLVMAKGGSKLKESDPKQPKSQGESFRRGSAAGQLGEITSQSVPLDRLARMLSSLVDREVVDKTGLTGKYDIALRWLPEQAAQADPSANVENSGASIFTAIQEQLGLKLESSKAMIDTVVVDHIEMPSEN